MRKLYTGLVLLIFAIVLLPLNLHPCTTFCFKNNGAWVFGRNYDFEIEYGLIIVNKRGVAKTALLSPGTVGQPEKWVSKYGSMTFNQFGRELPLGGMNEAGLIIELMWLTPTEYPNSDQRPALRELQWIQYQLDTAATVQDVIASDKAVRIETNSMPIHFLLCDRKGGAAAIEFLGGRMRVYTGKDLPVKALTNDTYEYCQDFLKLSGSDETTPSFEQANNSLRRFVWAAKGTQGWDAKTSSKDPVGYAFQILDKADLSNSKFRIVYDMKAGLIYFRTKSTPEVRSIDFRQFDYSCGTPVKILDMLADLKGDVTSQFQDYTWEANYNLIKKSFSETSFLKGTPETSLNILSKYPESLHCK